MSEILPCLMPPAWAGKEDAVCRPLCAGSSSPHMPWVAFGCGSGDSFEPVLRSRLPPPAGTELRLQRAALRRLRRRPGGWQRWDVMLGRFQRLAMLTLEGDDFAAERILDPILMWEAHRRLRTPMLLAATPRRRALLVTDARSDDLRTAAFLALAAQQCHEAGPEALSPAAFSTCVGYVSAIVDVAADMPAMAGASAGRMVARAWDGGDEPYVASLVVKDARTGREALVITAVHDDIGRLTQAIAEAMSSVVPEHLRRPSFSGDVEVVVSADGPSSDLELSQLRLRLGQVASSLCQGTGRAVRLSVRADRA